MKLKYFFKIIVLFFLGMFVHAQTLVNTRQNLQTAINAAVAGSTIMVKNGTYTDFYASVSKLGTAENPITIKAETVGGVILTGDSRFTMKKAAHIIFEGFVFDCTSSNTLIKLEACNNIRITRNVFELKTQTAIKWIVVGGTFDDYTFQFLSHHNRIDHNIFKNKLTGGNFITIDGTYSQDKTIGKQSQYDRIDHNYFFNNSPRAVNEKESIRIGNSQLCNSSGFTTVDFNLFEDCDGDPEIVSVKSNDNFILHNTFNKNLGTLTLRQGNRTRVEGNYFFGGGKANAMLDKQPIYTGGIRVYGTDHVIVNNYMEGLQGTIWDAPITLTQGEVITGQSTNTSLHYRPERITIAYNTLVNNSYGIEIGYPKADGSYNKKVADIKIANNLVVGLQNQLVKIHADQNGAVTWSNNIMYATGTANIITGGSAFASNEVVIQNPNLALNGTIWKATNTSPLVANGISTLALNQDIEGQLRPAISNPGADHFSSELPTYFPVGITDVGPGAEEVTLSVITSKLPTMLLSPNPTKGNFELALPNFENELDVALYNIHGELISNKRHQVVSGKIQLSLDNQPVGMYIVRIKSGEETVNYKVVKQ